MGSTARTQGTQQPEGIVGQPNDLDRAYLRHTVKRGEFAYAIAEKYGITYEALVAENDGLRRTNGQIQAGQTLYIPNAASSAVYTVRRGDTLYDIARAKNVDLDDLRAANRGRIGADNLIRIGQQLMLPSAAPQPMPRPVNRDTMQGAKPQPMSVPENTVTSPQLMTPDATKSGVTIRPTVVPRPLSERPAESSAIAPSAKPMGAAPIATTSANPTAVTPTIDANAAVPTPMVDESVTLANPVAVPSTTTDANAAAPTPMVDESVTSASPVSTAPVAPIELDGLSATTFAEAQNPYRNRVLQRMINRAGGNIAVDGAVGSGTRGAIQQFQEREGLLTQQGVRPGQIDPRTWTALVAAAQAPTTPAGVRFDVSDRDLATPQIAAAYRMVSALAHDDPRRLRNLLSMDRAHSGNDDLVIDRATLEGVSRRVQANGFGLKNDPTWTYNEARAVADLVSGDLEVDRKFRNSTYDAQITRIANEELRQSGLRLPAGFDLPAYVKAMMSAESSFNPEASSGVAHGLMQLTRDTASDMGLRRDEIYNVETNIRGGVRRILQMLERYMGRGSADAPAFSAAAYNAGPGNVGSSIPNWTETLNHARIVDTLYALYRGTDEPRSPSIPPLPRPRPVRVTDA